MRRLSKSVSVDLNVMGGSPPECKTIVEIAEGSTLLAAITAAGLVDTLSGEGPLTVFAPRNDAFDALPAGTVESLLLPENKEQLTGLLAYHVAAGKVKSDDLENGPLPTLNGADVIVDLTDGIMINDANVVTQDIEACNGVIHVIDAVLIPPPPGKKFGCLECMCRHWSFLFLFPILILRPFSYIHLSNQNRRLHHLLIL